MGRCSLYAVTMVTCMDPEEFGNIELQLCYWLLLATIKDPLMIEAKERERGRERVYTFTFDIPLRQPVTLQCYL